MNHQALTVAQFCAAHGNMSRTLFYELLKQGRGPVTFKLGRKTLISSHAAADWVKRMESESNPIKSFYEVIG
jgi:predicted DNA-binding transcriptional regulator AlpA